MLRGGDTIPCPRIPALLPGRILLRPAVLLPARWRPAVLLGPTRWLGSAVEALRTLPRLAVTTAIAGAVSKSLAAVLQALLGTVGIASSAGYALSISIPSPRAGVLAVV